MVQCRTEVLCRERAFSNVGVLEHLNSMYVSGPMILLSAKGHENAVQKGRGGGE